MSEPTGSTGPTDPTDPTRPMSAAPPPSGQPGAATSGRPPKGPNLWRQATSTTGGTIAVIVAGALTALLVVGVLAVGATAAVRAVAGHGDDRGDRMEQMRDRRAGDLPPGQQRRLENGPMGGGQPKGNGRGNGNGRGDGANGLGGPGGLGMGSMMNGVGGLGAVQHGEFTVQDSTGEAVVMTVQRGTVTAASDTSVSVKSPDGFTATYAVDDSTRGRAGDVAKDDTVLVVAQKTGNKAVVVREVRAS